jgi:glycosyltransferase involved in cell wall biosynthesis
MSTVKLITDYSDLTKPKVLHVIDTLNVGGAERVFVDLTNILFKNGISVSVLVLTERDQLKRFLDDRIPYFNLKRRNKWNLSTMLKLNRICRRFDIIHIHLRFNLKYLGISKLIFGGSFKLVLHDHFGDIEGDVRIPNGLAYFMRNAYFIGVHPQLATWALNFVKMNSQRVFLLPNIVVRKIESPSHLQNNKEIRAVIVSNFRESKNLTFAIELMEALSDTNIKLDIIGHVVDNIYYNSILQKIKRLKLSSKIILIHDVSEIQSILCRYDFALHTAKLESGPLVLLEYLAQSLPFLSYKTGQVSSKLSSPFPEFFLNDFNLESWVSKIKNQFWTDKSLNVRMKSYFTDNYSQNKYFEECIAIYKKILSHR